EPLLSSVGIDAPEPQRTWLQLPPKVARRQRLPTDQVQPPARLRNWHPGSLLDEAIWVGDGDLTFPGVDVERPHGREPAFAPLVDLRRERDRAGIEHGHAGLLLDLTNQRLERELAGLEAAAWNRPERPPPGPRLPHHEQLVAEADDRHRNLQVLRRQRQRRRTCARPRRRAGLGSPAGRLRPHAHARAGGGRRVAW